MNQGFDDNAETVVVRAFSPGAIYADAYCIEKMIAKNGTTFVYQAHETRGERPVVLKILRRAPSSRDDIAERFAREGTILNALDHPAVVRLFDVGAASDGTFFLAMERLPGETLAARLKREKTLPLADVLHLFSAAADALQSAHALGVVHRDLKPENLFLPSEGKVPLKVLDFGLSSLMGDGHLTQTGDAIGTPKYMAPEQIISAKNASASVDVYALAVCVYECLAGVSPYGEVDRAQLLGAIMHGRSRPLASVLPELSHISPILEKALSLKAEDRFASIAAFMTALRLASETDSISSPGGAHPLDHVAFKGVASVTEVASTRTASTHRFSEPPAAPRARAQSHRAAWVFFAVALVLGALAVAYRLSAR